MSRIARWSLLLAALTACADQSSAPPVPAGAPGASALTAEIGQLPSGGTSNSIMAKAVSPRGWVLGNFYLKSGGPTRAQSWTPYPHFAVATITDTGSIYSVKRTTTATSRPIADPDPVHQELAGAPRGPESLFPLRRRIGVREPSVREEDLHPGPNGIRSGCCTS